MADMQFEQPIERDLLEVNAPGLDVTSDMPSVAPSPDAPAVPPEDTLTSKDAKEDSVATGEAEQLEESATSTTDEQNGQPAGIPRGVGKRLAELTRLRDEADARAEAERTEKDRILKLLEDRLKPYEPEPAQDLEPEKPQRGAFADVNDWEQAVVDYADRKAAWSSRQEIKAYSERQQQEAQQRQIEEGNRAAQDAYKARVDTYKAAHADYEAVAERADVQVSMPMAAAIVHSEHGPAIQYYLGQNPAEATRIMALSPPQQLMALGRIEAQLNAPAPKPAISAAPKPIKPITPGSEPPHKSPEDESMDEYATRRSREIRETRARH